jgi:hypothetical protein
MSFYDVSLKGRTVQRDGDTPINADRNFDGWVLCCLFIHLIVNVLVTGTYVDNSASLWRSCQSG